MPIAYIFWMLVILWAIFGVYPFVVTTPNQRIINSGNLLVLVLIVLLGLQVFGSVVK